jgi:hypothetical protein
MQVAASLAVAEIDGAIDIGIARQMLRALHPDLMNDSIDRDKCEPALHVTMVMNRAAPLCEIMGVNTSAGFLPIQRRRSL